MYKRLLCIWLCVLMLVPALILAASEGGSIQFIMMGYEPEGTYRKWEDNLFFQRMSEKTGITFEFRQFSSARLLAEAKSAMTADGELPDAFFKADLTPAEAIDLLDRGVLIDLKALLPTHAPNLWAILSQNESYMEAVALPDGSIATLPYIDLAPAQNCMWINKKWLQTLKLPIPTNAEELEQVLVAMRDKDPNQNGRKDEVPLAFLGAYDLKYLAHAFGLIANDFNVFEEKGTARFMPLEDSFRDFIAWSGRMYAEGLLDREGFSTADTMRRVTDAKSTMRYGVVMAPLVTQLLPLEWAADYAVIAPLRWQEEQRYRSIASPVTNGTFAITSACEDPGALLKWVDYLYSEEGAIMAANGVEKVDYVIDGDGTWRKTESANQMGFLSDVSIVTGAVPPGITADEFQRLYSDTQVRYIIDQVALVTDVALEPFPAYALSLEQEAAIAPLQSAIGRYVDESIARWVLGEWEITDTQFAVFVQELNGRGLQEFMTFWQDILDTRKEVVR